MAVQSKNGSIEGGGGPVGYGIVGEVTAEPSKSRRLREVLSDAYTFIRSAESNRALATVTLEELMGDQIKRNGDSDSSNSSQYNPYSYEPDKNKPASEEPEKRANFLGGSDTGRPTKLDMLLAIKNELEAVVKEVKNSQPLEVAGREEYSDASEVAAPSEE